MAMTHASVGRQHRLFHEDGVFAAQTAALKKQAVERKLSQLTDRLQYNPAIGWAAPKAPKLYMPDKSRKYWENEAEALHAVFYEPSHWLTAQGLRETVNEIHKGNPIAWISAKPAYNKKKDVDGGINALNAPFAIVVREAAGLLDLLDIATNQISFLLDENARLKGAAKEPVRMQGIGPNIMDGVTPTIGQRPIVEPDSITMPKPTSKTPANGRTPPIKGEKRPGVPIEEIQEATAARLPKPAKYRVKEIVKIVSRDGSKMTLIKLSCGDIKRIDDNRKIEVGRRMRCYACIKSLPVRAG